MLIAGSTKNPHRDSRAAVGSDELKPDQYWDIVSKGADDNVPTSRRLNYGGVWTPLALSISILADTALFLALLDASSSPTPPTGRYEHGDVTWSSAMVASSKYVYHHSTSVELLDAIRIGDRRPRARDSI